jgi:hypothetical protein
MINILKNTLTILIVVAIQFYALGTLWASDSTSDVLQLENLIEGRIIPIIRSFDSSAFVSIHINPKKSSAQVLPGTAYTFQSLEIKNQNENLEVENAEIIIFGKEKQKLEAALPIITKVIARFNINPIIHITDYVVPETSGTIGKKLLAQSAAEKKEDEATKARKAFIDRSFKNFQNTVWAVMGAGFVFLFIIIIVINKASEKLTKSLGKNLQSLASSIESSEKDERNYNRSDEKATSQASLSEAPHSQSFYELSDHSEVTYLACLADCYWGQYDSYASFLWKRMPVNKRRAVLEEASLLAPYLNEYVAVVSSLLESNLAVIDDPAYLNPLTIYHINNEELTILVRENNALIASLSPLRLKGLSLSIGERISLNEIQFEKLEPVDISFKMIPKSEYRIIKRHVTFEIKNIAEESELLRIDNISSQMIKEIPSLAWSMKLSDQDIEEILKDFSAKDLASAWVAPEFVLTHLAQFIPSKKHELLESSKKKITPSRDSLSFTALHGAIAKKINEKLEGKEKSREEDKDRGTYDISKKAA